MCHIFSKDSKIQTLMKHAVIDKIILIFHEIAPNFTHSQNGNFKSTSIIGP